MKKGRRVVCLLFGLVLFAACGNEVSNDEPGASDPAKSPGQAARVIEVTLSFIEPRFRPDPIEVKVGEPVQFKVSSADTRHRFIIETLGIDLEVPQKSMHESVTTQVVTPTEANTFRIFCSIHARMPMEGTLLVSETGKP